MGYVIHKELAGTPHSLAASVLVTLLEVRKNGMDVKVDEGVIRGALECINNADVSGNRTADAYANAVTAYALNLYESVRPLLGEDMPDMSERALAEVEVVPAAVVGATLLWCEELA